MSPLVRPSLDPRSTPTSPTDLPAQDPTGPVTATPLRPPGRVKADNGRATARAAKGLDRVRLAGRQAMVTGVVVGSGGLAAASVAATTAVRPWVPISLGCAGPALGAAMTRAGYRTGQQQRLQTHAGLVAAAHLGMPGPMRSSGRPVVSTTQWRGRGVGTPRRITIHLTRHLAVSDLQLNALLRDLQGFFDQPYRISRRTPARVFLRATGPSAPVPADPAGARVRRTIGELFGTAARVENLVNGPDGNPARFDVSYDSGARVVAAGWRGRAERTVSVMLPARWRAVWDLEHDRVRFEVRPTLPAVVDRPRDLVVDVARRRIPIAIDEDGLPVWWNLRRAPHLLISGQTGSGKALAIDTPIRTPHGWSEMGALQAGDTVFDETGAPCTVTTAHPVMTGRPCYEVVFSDRSVIVADAEHLWATMTRAERVQGADPSHGTPAYTSEQIAAVERVRADADREPDRQVSCVQVVGEIGEQYLPLVYKLARPMTPTSTVHHRYQRRDARGSVHGVQHPSMPAAGYSRQLLLKAIATHMATPTNAARVVAHDRIVTTEQIATTLHANVGRHANHAVAVAGPLQLPSRDLLVDPYLLGVWLRDGATHNATVFSADQAIVAAFADAGYPVAKDKTDPYAYRIGGGFRTQLRQLGVIRNKHIPRDYLDADVDARRQLLAGLLDADGWVEGPRGHRYGTTSARLLDGVLDLVHGLGLQTRVTSKTVRGRGPASSTCWTVGFTTDQPVFRLARKHDRVAPGSPRATGRRRYIVDVRAVPSVPVRCITVDSPNRLYLAGRSLIPTHNTVAITSLVQGIAQAGWRLRIVDPKRLEYKGLRGWPNVEVVATTVEDMIATIWCTHQLMEERYRQVDDDEATEEDFEPVFLVLDEYRELQRKVTQWWTELRIQVKGLPTKCPVFDWVNSIAGLGRSAEVRMVLGLQRPDAEFLTGEMRSNFRARLGMGRLGPEDARMMWNNSATGVAVPKISGRGTADGGDLDVPSEVQVFFAPDPRRVRDDYDRELVERHRPTTSTYPACQVVLDESDDTDAWQAIRSAELLPLTQAVPAATAGDDEPRPGPRDQDGPQASSQPTPDPGGPARADTDEAGPAEARTDRGDTGEWPPRGRRLRGTRPSRGSGPGTVTALRTQTVRTQTVRTQTVPSVDPGGGVDEDLVDPDEDGDGGYGPPEPAAIADLEPGDMVEVERGGASVWAVVSGVEPDVDDPDAYAVEYRLDEEDLDGQLILADDCLLQRRRPAGQDHDGTR